MNSVLILGGYGGFGSRLCRRLGADGWRVLVAGRNAARARDLAGEIPDALAVRADRNGDIAPLLAEHRPLLLIDAAGPFQGSHYRVPEACIAQGVHYLDLADAREFVCGIGALDEAADAAQVAVIAGASSVPALSGAVIRKLADGLARVDAIDVALSASDRATAGTSVATAILSYVGKPVALWKGQRWSDAGGFQQLSRLQLQGSSTRRFSRMTALADVPDLAIWPRVLPGRPATFFHAGPEFGFQVIALWLLSWSVRWGWIGSLKALAPLLRPLQAITRRFSDGRSAMTVELAGHDGKGLVRRRWELLARDGVGPEIPVLAAQLLARRVASGALEPGARDAHAELDVTDFDEVFEEIGITCETASSSFTALYARVLGERLDILPESVRTMHEIGGDGGASGEAMVERGSNPLARLVGWIMRFPPAGRHALHVSFEEGHGRETWTRDFDGRRFQSVLAEHDGHLTERFGPMRFAFDLPVTSEGLDMKIVRWWAFGLPLPLALAPRVAACENVREGRFAFDVSIALPLIGRIVHYRGTLAREPTPPQPRLRDRSPPARSDR